jgi:hypothetical protein
MSAWVSVERAPRDGTDVDLWVFGPGEAHRVTDARWTSNVGGWRMPVLEPECWRVPDPETGEWREVEVGGRRATHFMLIPEGPRT